MLVEDTFKVAMGEAASKNVSNELDCHLAASASVLDIIIASGSRTLPKEASAEDNEAMLEVIMFKGNRTSMMILRRQSRLARMHFCSGREGDLTWGCPTLTLRHHVQAPRFPFLFASSSRRGLYLSKICKAFSKAHNRKFKKLDLLPWFTSQVSETDDWTFVVEQDGWMMTVTRVAGKMLVDGASRCNYQC